LPSIGHGQSVGYFIPTQGQVEADIAALKKASKTLDKLLEAQGVDVEKKRSKKLQCLRSLSSSCLRCVN